MSNELKQLLLILAVSVPVGLVTGIALRLFRPGWCKIFAKLSRNRPWKILAPGAVVFCVMAVVSVWQGRYYFAAFFAVWCFFELLGLVLWGFKSLTPEQERAIDESDPRKLWPLWLKKPGEGDHA